MMKCDRKHKAWWIGYPQFLVLLPFIHSSNGEKGKNFRCSIKFSDHAEVDVFYELLNNRAIEPLQTQIANGKIRIINNSSSRHKVIYTLLPIYHCEYVATFVVASDTIPQPSRTVSFGKIDDPFPKSQSIITFISL
jgi:hypothetical protein